MNDFAGSTYIPEFDRDRLHGQQVRVFDATSPGGWLTLGEIQGFVWLQTGHRDPEASISARLRDLRKAGCVVERRRRGDPKAGVHEYRVLVPAGAVQ
jgi:hypothetical protein